MDENDIGLEMKFNGERYIATRHNTVLFTFFGSLAMYDHVFMVPEQGETGPLGGYIWNEHSVYESLVQFIQEYKFMQRLNSTDIAQCDLDAWNQAHPSGLYLPDTDARLPRPDYSDVEDLYFNDSFPEEWGK